MTALWVGEVDDGEENAGSSQTALIIDDDPEYVHLLGQYVKQCFPGFSVESCRTSRDAIQLCMSKEYCVLLIDFNLPDLKGSKFLHRLQSKTGELPPPSIVLAAEGGASAASEVLRANAYDFIPKSQVNRQSIERSVKNAIAKHALKKSVQTRTRELECANKSLREKNREIQEFYQTISHEVKTPLSASREFVALVRDGVLGKISAQQAEALEYALAGCDQIASHFNGLIEMTRLDTGKISLQKSETSLKSLLTRSMASTARVVAEKNITLNSPADAPDVEIFVDQDRINQVVSNLLSNAVNFTPIDGVIGITYEVMENNLRLCVEDSGCGIGPDELDAVFMRLYRVNQNGKDQYAMPGLGLGLSISKEIVLLHSGKIWVESEVGNGSRFYVELPCNNMHEWNQK